MTPFKLLIDNEYYSLSQAIEEFRGTYKVWGAAMVQNTELYDDLIEVSGDYRFTPEEIEFIIAHHISKWG